MRMEERRRAEYAGKGNMEMNTLFLFSANGIVQKADTGCEKRRFFQQRGLQKEGRGHFSIQRVQVCRSVASRQSEPTPDDNSSNWH